MRATHNELCKSRYLTQGELQQKHLLSCANGLCIILYYDRRCDAKKTCDCSAECKPNHVSLP